jgi:hypothetical protein
MALTINSTISWIVLLCTLDRAQCFGGTYISEQGVTIKNIILIRLQLQLSLMQHEWNTNSIIPSQPLPPPPALQFSSVFGLLRLVNFKIFSNFFLLSVDVLETLQFKYIRGHPVNMPISIYSVLFYI